VIEFHCKIMKNLIILAIRISKLIQDIKLSLDEKVKLYNNAHFIEKDPVSIPHLFDLKEDIEIAGFFAATFAWGQRATSINKAKELMKWMDYSPYEYITQGNEKDFEKLNNFKHRTFNGADCIFFIRSLQNIYHHHGGLEKVFNYGLETGKSDMMQAIIHFRKKFLEYPHESRSAKHLPDPGRGSSAKRINLFLRWMVRKDECGVDFGIWNSIRPSDLFCPLDVHSGRTARNLGLLYRKQNDWKAVEELTLNLRQLDPVDPVKYDFALFGLGIFEKF